jgi:sec-independent protein translocase protein TatC
MAKQKNEHEMTFWEHFEELRWVLVRSVIAVIAGAILAFVFYRVIFDEFVFAPMSPSFFTNRILCDLAQQFNIPVLCINSKPLEIININLAGQFTMHLVVSMYSGLIVAFPYIIYQLWSFIKPALSYQERKSSRMAVLFISMLFFTGVLFGYYIIAPLTIHFLGTYNVSEGVVNTININSYIGSLSSVTLASGIVFELPILILFLTKMGLVTPSFLRKYRKHSFVAIMILAAIITPPDVISLILVVLPLYILFEISILLSSRINRKKKE